jgi:two-component system response regulator
MAYLRGDSGCPEAVRPDIVVLDLNMPGKDGREVLAEIKADDTLKNIPVLILSTSNAEKDMEMANRLKAVNFVTKPLAWDDYKRLAQSLETYCAQRDHDNG